MVTGHRSRVLRETGQTLGKVARQWKRMDRLRGSGAFPKYVRGGVDQFGNIVRDLNARPGKHPERKPKEKK